MLNAARNRKQAPAQVKQIIGNRQQKIARLKRAYIPCRRFNVLPAGRQAPKTATRLGLRTITYPMFLQVPANTRMQTDAKLVASSEMVNGSSSNNLTSTLFFNLVSKAFVIFDDDQEVLICHPRALRKMKNPHTHLKQYQTETLYSSGECLMDDVFCIGRCSPSLSTFRVSFTELANSKRLTGPVTCSVSCNSPSHPAM